jgi:tungstate transport system substrate-binding protein
MTDRGTYIKYEDTLKGNPPLQVLVEKDAVLLNQYSVIAMDKKHCSKAKYDTAEQFIEWITGSDAQQLIGNFKLLGKPLFTPNAKK